MVKKSYFWNNILNQWHVSWVDNCKQLVHKSEWGFYFQPFIPIIWNNRDWIISHFVISICSCQQPRWKCLWQRNWITGLGLGLLASTRESSISGLFCSTRATQERVCHMVGKTIRKIWCNWCTLKLILNQFLWNFLYQINKIMANQSSKKNAFIYVVANKYNKFLANWMISVPPSFDWPYTRSTNVIGTSPMV